MIGTRSARSTLTDYLALTKPPIILLLLITALGGMLLAAQGLPPLRLILLVLVGGALAAGGASSINHVLDRDLDGRMARTRQRPIPSDRTKPWEALLFGLALNIIAFAILAMGVNILSAGLALSGTLIYVFVYTIWLKRTTTHNIVVGGAAGAVPPLVGWAAVTGGIDLPAIYLFSIVFFWTPPHFWALALLIKDDYARAGVPMLPVVQGVNNTQRSIFLYTLVLVALTLMFYTLHQVGWIYLSAALGLGACFILLAGRLLVDGSLRRARQVYLYSLLYLALLFGAVMLDSVL